SSAAAVRLTRMSSATFPKRRTMSGSRSGLSSVITASFLPAASLIYLRAQVPYAYLVAHASTVDAGPVGPRRAARRRRVARRPRDRRLAFVVAGTRDANPP